MAPEAEFVLLGARTGTAGTCDARVPSSHMGQRCRLRCHQNQPGRPIPGLCRAWGPSHHEEGLRNSSLTEQGQGPHAAPPGHPTGRQHLCISTGKSQPMANRVNTNPLTAAQPHRQPRHTWTYAPAQHHGGTEPSGNTGGSSWSNTNKPPAPALRAAPMAKPGPTPRKWGAAHLGRADGG